MPHVLHVITDLGVGGAEMALYRLVTSSAGSDYTHSVVALTPGGAICRRFHEQGIEPVSFDFKRAPLSHFFRLVLLIRKMQPDIVQTWLYHADLLGGVAARLAGNRSVIWGVHSTDLSGEGRSRSVRAMRRLCASVSTMVPRAIVCVAEASRRTHAAVGYDERRMVVVPNGFDPSRMVATNEQRNALREQCGILPDQIVIGSLGRFNAVKDPHNFVHAAGRLARLYPDARFLMVGRGMHSENAQLTAWIAQTGCADRFVLLGERQDVPACLAAMDVFCLHSRNEAFPLVLGEAMAMGLPCVATDVGDVAIMLGNAGMIVPREDPDRLADALGQVLRMEAGQRRQLGSMAKERMRTQFTMDQVRIRFETLYRSIAESPSTP